jgi:hypothetical protein
MSTFFVLSLQYFQKVLSVVSLFSFIVAAFICMFCICMIYSTSYCCHYKLMDPWNVCMYARICVCVCAHTCVCIVCMYTCTYICTYVCIKNTLSSHNSDTALIYELFNIKCKHYSILNEVS